MCTLICSFEVKISDRNIFKEIRLGSRVLVDQGNMEDQWSRRSQRKVSIWWRLWLVRGWKWIISASCNIKWREWKSRTLGGGCYWDPSFYLWSPVFIGSGYTKGLWTSPNAWIISFDPAGCVNMCLCIPRTLLKSLYRRVSLL